LAVWNKRELVTCDLTQLTKRYAGDNVDSVVRMIVDSDSSVYIGANSFSTGSHGKQDVLVLKLDSSFVQQWGKFWGGNQEETTGDMAVSTDGVYIVGNTQTASMTNGDRDIFILKLSKTDGSKTFATLFGSTSFEYGISIKINSGAIYVGGYTGSSGWTAGGADFLLLKLDSSGNKQWARHYGGTNSDLISDILVSGSSVFAYGSGDIGAGGDDLLILQASTTDGSLSSFRYLTGATNAETASRMIMDSSGNLYLTGTSSSSGLTHGFTDIIVMKVNPSTYAIEWGIYTGSTTKSDYVQDILLSSDETSIFLIGFTDATGITFGNNDILMIKASSSTGANEFIIHLGGDIQDYGRTMYVEANGKYLIAGDTTSSSLSAAATSDILLFEIDSQGRNQCSLLQRADVTASLSSSSFSTVTFTLNSFTPTTSSITEATRSVSGDSITSSTVSFGDICTNYYPVVPTEGVTTPIYAYQDFTFSTTLTEFCDTAGSVLTYSLLQSDSSAVPSWMTFTASTRTITGIPTSSDVGTVNLAYTATDGTGESSTETIVLYVQRKPVVANSIPNQSVRTSATLTYTIPSNTFSDADGDTLTITMINTPSWASFTSSTQVLTGTPSDTNAGQYVATVTATDPSGASVSTTLTTTVIHNLAPIVVNEIPDQSVAIGAYSYTFATNTFSDGNSDTLTYSASGLPTWMAFDSSTRTLSGTSTDNWEYNITITASDGYGGSASDIFLLVIGTGIPNTFPTVNRSIPDQTAYTTKYFEYTLVSGTFSDADGDSLAITATRNDGSALPSWLVLSGTIFSGIASSSDTGSYVIKVTASDGKGGTASTTFTIKVEPYSSSSDGIAAMLIVAIVIIILLIIIVIAILIIRKRRIDKRRAIQSDSSSDDEEDEIIDRTGALTQFLANTHSLEGNKFIPNPSVGAIYQKKSLDALFTPQDSVKKFFKNRYGFEYDEERGVFTTNTATFEGSAMRKTNYSKFNQEDIKEEDEEDKDEENHNINGFKEEIKSDKKKPVSPKILVKAQHRKGKDSPKSKKGKLNKTTLGKSSPKLKGKLNKARSKSPKVKNKSMKDLKSPSNKKGRLIYYKI
jgi:hypothetical protein